jgi:phage-related protein
MAAEEKSEPGRPKPKKKPLHWIASSRRDLRAFPEEVKDVMGFALYQAQVGSKHESAKVLKGFQGAGVLEIVDDHDGDTYRGVYTVKFEGVVYVLDAFQKKAKKGAKTPQQDIEHTKNRLKAAERHSKMRSQARKEK